LEEIYYGEPEDESEASFLRKKNMRKEFLEREGKGSLCYKRSLRLKICELNVQLARELETMKILSGVMNADCATILAVWILL